MKLDKISHLMLSGAAIALAGVIMLISEQIGVGLAKIIVPLLFIVGGASALMFSQANKHFKIANQFHLLQGAGMIIFGLLIAFVPKGLPEFLKYVTFFIMLFGFLEIMFSFMILNSNLKVKFNILLSRLLGGFVGLIGAVVLLMTSMTNAYTGLMVAGVLTLLGGLSFILFAQKIKGLA